MGYLLFSVNYAIGKNDSWKFSQYFWGKKSYVGAVKRQYSWHLVFDCCYERSEKLENVLGFQILSYLSIYLPFGLAAILIQYCNFSQPGAFQMCWHNFSFNHKWLKQYGLGILGNEIPTHLEVAEMRKSMLLDLF